MSRFALGGSLLVALILGSVFPAHAQPAPPAAVIGVITDPTGATVADTVVDLFGPARRTVRSDRDGGFVIDMLPPGEYRLVVQREGFATFTNRFALTPAERREETVALALANAVGIPAAFRVVGRVGDSDSLRVPRFRSRRRTGDRILALATAKGRRGQEPQAARCDAAIRAAASAPGVAAQGSGSGTRIDALARISLACGANPSGLPGKAESFAPQIRASDLKIALRTRGQRPRGDVVPYPPFWL